MSDFFRADKLFDSIEGKLRDRIPELQLETGRWSGGVPVAAYGIAFHSPVLEKRVGDAYPTFYRHILGGGPGINRGFGDIGVDKKDGAYTMYCNFYFGRDKVPSGPNRTNLIRSNNNPDPHVSKLADEFGKRLRFKIDHRYWRDKYAWSLAKKIQKFKSRQAMEEAILRYVSGYVEILSKHSPPQEAVA